MPKSSTRNTKKSAPQRPPRLQKVLAEAGLGSRRQCEEFIRAGRVTIDGDVVSDLGVRVDPAHQELRLDGEPIRRERKRFFLLNKPAGYLCTNRDPAGRPRVIDLFPNEDERLFTVGRLDENSEGLLIVTNDGEMSHRLAHPRFEIPRTYTVQVVGSPTPETLQQLRRGMFFREGKFRVARVKRLKSRGKSSFLEIVMTQGRNREIRRLLARVGHKVIHLKRTAFGPLKLGRLTAGRYRPLKPKELEALRECVEAPRRPARKKRAPRSSDAKTTDRPRSKSGTSRKKKKAADPAKPRKRKRSTGRAKRQ
jgi:23S rRNA pseudouridine2605 synthase